MPVPGRRKITTAVLLPLFVAALEIVALHILVDNGINAISAGTMTIADFLAKYLSYLLVCWIVSWILIFVSLGLTISSIKDHRNGFRIFWLIYIILCMLIGIAEIVYFVVLAVS